MVQFVGSQRVGHEPGIEIVREVTSDRRYTNAAIAREIPWEQL